MHSHRFVLYLHTGTAASAAVGIIVYRYVGLAFLRRAWVNLDALWGAALILSGLVTLTV